MNDVVLFRSHKITPQVLKTYWRLSEVKRTVLLYDADKVPSLPKSVRGVGFTRCDLEGLGVRLTCDYRDCIDPANNGDPVWYNPEYPVLHYWMGHPQFDFYWSIDYDVVFNGPWSCLFDRIGDDSADLIGTKHYTTSVGWCWWPHYHVTFAVPRAYAIFFPLLRFSAAALETLLARYREGCHGFCEVVVPTILKNLGYQVKDVNEFGDFYTAETFWHREVRVPPRPDCRLYHKVCTEPRA